MPRVCVIGAGAAGTMAAIFSATCGAETTLLERTEDGGRKILISGGGRCNILPAHLDESRFVTDSSPHILRRIIRSWPLPQQIAFFERDLGIPLVEEQTSAKLFPRSQKAREVRDKLIDAARRRGVSFVAATEVIDLSPAARCWTVSRRGADPLTFDAVIVATGGLSVPHTGSDGGGLLIVERLGHVINRTYPALTPLTLDVKTGREPFPSDPGDNGSRPLFSHLSGISLPVTIAARSGVLHAKATGGFLFTHRGYSGPAVLDVSHVAVRSLTSSPSPAALTVQWTGLGEDEWNDALRTTGSRTLLAAIGAHLPQRLAEALLANAGIDLGRRLSQLTRVERLTIITALVRGALPWSGHEGYKKAEVTGGGVDLADVDPATMESRKHAGLFLCGEMLDAFGPIGGYNFFWAWVTGRAAGIAAAKVCY